MKEIFEKFWPNLFILYIGTLKKISNPESLNFLKKNKVFFL